METVTPAMISDMSLKYDACSSWTATGSVGFWRSEDDERPEEVRPRCDEREQAEHDGAPGRAAGSAMCQKVRIIDAPSTRAASMSS